MIKTLTVSKVGFWNGGNETIYINDIAEADPLRIETKDGNEILDVKVLYSTKPANIFKIHPEEENKKVVRIDFDFLDRDDGGVIQVIHTGKSSSDLNVTGTIKGAEKPSELKISKFFLPKEGDKIQDNSIVICTIRVHNSTPH